MPLVPDTSAAKRLKGNNFDVGSIGSSSMMLSPLPGFATGASPIWSAISGISGAGDSPYDYSKANRYKVIKKLLHDTTTACTSSYFN
jgi:hypothetical protein